MMFFRIKSIKIRLRKILPKISLKTLEPPSRMKKLDNRIERASFKSPASASVEATAVFPVLIFFFMTIVWMFRLFIIHSEIGSELTLIGNEMVACSYPYSVVTDGITNSSQVMSLAAEVGWTEGYVKGRLKKLSVYKDISMMTTLLSNFDEEDAVDIKVTYYVEPTLEIPGIKGVYLTNHFYSHIYTGYGGRETSDEEMVYITPTGEVYHTRLDCRGLKTTIKTAWYSHIEYERNADGSKYYPCEKCMGEETGIVYITPYGNRYHSTKNCTELKVDIFQVPLSEVKGRRKCFYCH